MSPLKTDLPYGTLDLLILKTLDTMGAMHGYSIARRIEQVSESLMRLSQGSVYPALIRLEQAGWIRTEWGVSETNRKVKFYALTKAGARQLRVEVEQLGKSHGARGQVSGGQTVTFRSLVQRLLALTRTRRLDRELDDEVRAHLELAERDARAAGLSPEEARRAARRNFGGLEQMKETHRDERSVRWLDTLTKDVRYGLLMLVRDPGFAVVAISVMAIGIGANTAMFSLVDAVLLKPLPFANPDRIVRVMEAPTPTSRNGIATLNFVDWKRLSTSFEALSATRGLSVALTGQGEPARLGGLLVSSDYFDVFGVKPLAGRTFRRDEDQPGASPVVVLSHATWQTRFGGDPSILNRDVMLDGEPHQVVGILAAGSFAREETGFWKPLVFTPEQRTRVVPLARRRRPAQGRREPGAGAAGDARREREPGRTAAAVQEDLERRRRSVRPDARGRHSSRDDLRGVRRGRDGAAHRRGEHREPAAGEGRDAEQGDGRPGGARGQPRPARRADADREPRPLSARRTGGRGTRLPAHRGGRPGADAVAAADGDVGLDLRVLGFAAAVAVTVSLVVGLLPSLQNSSGRLSQALNRVSRGASGSREGVRRAIVVAEVAVSLVLICGAVLMFKSLLKLQRVDAGVRIDNVITMSADLSQAAYPTPNAPSSSSTRSRNGCARFPAWSAPRSRRTCRCSASGKASA